MDNQDISGPLAEKPALKNRFVTILLAVVMVILASGIAVTYFLGEYKLRQAADKAAAERERYMRAVDERSLAQQHADLRLFTIPLAWAVRKELIQRNYGQIEEYLNELIRQKQFRSVMLLDPDGTVRIASDRKLQGGSFSELYPGKQITHEGLVAYPLSQGTSLFLVPVMGLNEKIGTIAFVYSFGQLSSPE